MNRLTLALSRAEPVGYAALRIVSGFLFAAHGAQKVLELAATKAGPEVGSQLWVGGLIELVAGLLIMLGLFTRAAAFLSSGTMAVAYMQYHWKFAIDDWQWLPLVNKGELAVIYCFLFLYMVFRGGGAAALDGLLARRGGGAVKPAAG